MASGRAGDAHDAPIDPSRLPGAAGSYVLELDLDRTLRIRAGRLGEIELGPGRLRYYGSARGPGGVRARVARHLRREGRRPHWHINALTACVDVVRVWVDLAASECELCRRDLDSGRWEVAVRGFGASDCRTCPSHLLVSATGPDV